MLAQATDQRMARRPEVSRLRRPHPLLDPLFAQARRHCFEAAGRRLGAQRPAGPVAQRYRPSTWGEMQQAGRQDHPDAL